MRGACPFPLTAEGICKGMERHWRTQGPEKKSNQSFADMKRKILTPRSSMRELGDLEREV